jgi:murein DD-endopeptidase MepM/ murein hydrolase activator NlpD
MGFVLSAVLAAVSLVAAALPAITIPTGSGGDGDDPLFPAPPGYLLPWPGGEIEAVTQGEETSFTHNGLTAYAFDFGLAYDAVVAARSGRVSMVFTGSNKSACDPAFNVASNYVVIDHGDGTSALYLHLAYDSSLVQPGDLVEQGQPIAVSGDTGMTCSDTDENAPAPHLHFQVQSTVEDRYLTQSLPIAFDDVPDNDGVPVEGESYVSGNYGSGKPQKTPLSPRRSERVFAPKATPADPSFSEIPFAEQTPLLEWPTAAPTETPADTETPTETATETPTETPTPLPTDTPVPTATPTPVPTDTPPPAPSDTPTPEPLTDTPTPEPPPTDTPTPEPTP